WEKSNIPSIGFRHDYTTPQMMPTLRTLSETLPTELINRFRSELLILRPLEIRDYEEMLKTTAQMVPVYLRETFLRLGLARLKEVARLRQGTRFLEELMLDTLASERGALRRFSLGPHQLELPL